MKHFLSRKLLYVMALVLLLAIMIGAVVPAASVSAKPAQQTWNLVWADEFNGSAVDTSNWTFETGGGGWGNNELQYYTNGANAIVSGGILTIEARQQSMGGYAYTSTRIKTQGKRQFQYGRYEARLAVPMGQGLWPAFWMLGANFASVGWPASGEIDIMEHINTQNTTYGTLHWDFNGYATYGGNTAVNNPAAFHTYAIEWNSSSIKWFLDGAQFHEANILNNINGTDEFHRPFFFLLNLAVGGNWPGNPNGTASFPARYQIDYVRVYQLGTGPVATATRTNTPVPGATATRTPTPPPSGSGVIFYQNSNYGGTASGAKAPGNYASLPGDVPNDWMSSLRVPAGWTVQAYEHGNFGGAVCTFTADTSFVGTACNDRMSSFRITQGSSGSSQGVDNVSSNQARVWYKCAGTCQYVIVHYTVAGGGQQNVNATYNSALARWEYTITGITAGQVLQYNFTYNIGGVQSDTAWFSWTKP